MKVEVDVSVYCTKCDYRIMVIKTESEEEEVFECPNCHATVAVQIA